jgi:Uma2 family endonuclease
VSTAPQFLPKNGGPWTIADVEALPETGNHARYEILSPGVLTVSPAPETPHQRASSQLWLALSNPAIRAGADVEVLEAVNVQIPGERLTIPDVVVVEGQVADTNPVRWLPSAVHLIVEIESPSTKATDRAIKPDLYAEAGIECFWRLQLEPKPQLIAYELRSGQYEEAAILHTGARGRLEHPFPIELDPAELTRRRSG